MLILGICGGGDLPFQAQYPRGTFHDGAAVLVEDGVVVAAIEEERLNRIKHSNKAPVSAIRFCLAERGVRLEDLDAVAVGSSLGSPEKRPYTLSRKNTETVWARPPTSARSFSFCSARPWVGCLNSTSSTSSSTTRRTRPARSQ